MDLKQRVLRILEKNRGRNVNGALMAERLSVSRTAIWKIIKQLQDDGYGYSG